MKQVTFYQNERCLIAGGTLIRCQVEGERVSVPSRVETCCLSEIGMGALNLAFVRKLVVEEGYRTLADKCLVSTGNLSEIELPASLETVSGKLTNEAFPQHCLTIRMKRRLPQRTANDLRHLPRSDDGSILLQPHSLNLPGLKPLLQLTEAMSTPLPVIIRGAMEEPVFIWGPEMLDREKAFPKKFMFEPHRCFDRDAGFLQTAEYAVALQMVRRDASGHLANEAEFVTDLNARLGKQSAVETVLSNNRGFGFQFLITCRLGSQHPDGTEDAVVSLCAAYFFTPSLRKIRHGGRDWWLYCRNLLTGDSRVPYRRQDVCILDQAGLVTDRRTSEAVYAKYKFLSGL